MCELSSLPFLLHTCQGEERLPWRRRRQCLISWGPTHLTLIMKMSLILQNQAIALLPLLHSKLIMLVSLQPVKVQIIFMQLMLYNGEIFMFITGSDIPMTMKLCHRGLPTKTFNIHDLQQQIASGIIVRVHLLSQTVTIPLQVTMMLLAHLQLQKILLQYQAQ